MTLTTRQNGQTIDASWFNSIKTVIDGDLILTPLTVTADKTLGSDANVVTADSTSVAIDLDLPALADNDSKYYILKASDLTNGVTVNPDGSDTIDGDSSYEFANINEAIAIVGDATNTNWVIVSTAFDSTGGSGGSGGDVHQYGLINPTDYNLTTWNVTNLTNATLALETTDPLFSDSSYKLTNHASAAGEYAFGPEITVDFGRTGKSNVMTPTYTYDGVDDAIRFHFWDNTNAASLGYSDVKSTSIPTPIPVVEYVNDTVLAVTVRVEVITGEAADLIFDNITFSDDPFVPINILADQSTQYNAFSGYGSTNNKIYRLNGAVVRSSGSGFYTISDTAADGGSITITKRCKLAITLSGYHSVTQAVGYSLNSTQLTTAVFSINATDRLSNANFETGRSSVSIADWFDVGDVIRLHGQGAYSILDPLLNISAIGESTAVVHSSTGTENTFSARIQNNGTASILSQDVNFISSVTRSAAGDVDVVFTSGFFSVTPSITLSLSTANANSNVTVEDGTPSATGVTIKTTNGSVLTDYDFDITVKNQGADYKQPSAYAVTPLTETCYIKDVKSNGTAGGTSTSGSWQTRDLNTLSGDTGWCSLSANQFTLPSGKYEIEIAAPAYRIDWAVVKLYDITNAADVDDIRSGQFGTSTTTGFNAWGTAYGQLELSEPTTFEVQQRSNGTLSTTGMGRAASFGDNEIYTQVKITKLLWR